MLSKNKIKLINSLSQKKYRTKEKLFIAEGNKIAQEFISSTYNVRELVCTEVFYKTVAASVKAGTEVIIARQDEIKKCSKLKTPQQALVICEMPLKEFNYKLLHGKLVICLDGIQDPGNLGTIIRIANWFGIHTLCVSADTVDVFNPKVVQASMGSVLNVDVYYTDLFEVINYANQNNIATFGTFLSGANIYSENLPGNGIIVFGNEGSGISTGLEESIPNKLLIPQFNITGRQANESLNVSVSAAIVCSEFRRRC